MHTIKIILKKIKFGDKEVDKKEFYSSKQAISLDSVDLDKIVVSNKWKINETTYKYICGYLNNDVIQSLCVILPQIHGYIKYVYYIRHDKVECKARRSSVVLRSKELVLCTLITSVFRALLSNKIVGKGWVKST